MHRILEKAEAREPLSVIDTVTMSPTYTVDLARMTYALAFDNAPSGTCHVVNSGTATWFQLAERAVRLAGYETPVEPQATQTHVDAERPTSTPLAGELAGRAGDLQRPWTDAREEYVNTFWANPEYARAAG